MMANRQDGCTAPDEEPWFAPELARRAKAKLAAMGRVVRERRLGRP
jgi:hypothetical protein